MASKNKSQQAASHHPNLHGMTITDADVAEMIQKTRLPPLSAQSIHDLASVLSEYEGQRHLWSNEPEFVASRKTEAFARGQRIAKALATLQTDLPAFVANAHMQERRVIFGPGFIEPLIYAVDRVAPGFSHYRKHASVEYWHGFAERLVHRVETHFLREHGHPAAKSEINRSAEIIAFVTKALEKLDIDVKEENLPRILLRTQKR